MSTAAACCQAVCVRGGIGESLSWRAGHFLTQVRVDWFLWNSDIDKHGGLQQSLRLWETGTLSQAGDWQPQGF